MDQRVLFEVWKILQVFHEPERLARENGVLAEPVVHVAKPVYVAPPPPVVQTPSKLPRNLSVRTSSDVADKSNELETLERLLAFKEKSEKMPFVLVWSVIYQHLLLGRSQTPTNAFYSLKKINSQEKLEDELNKSNLLDGDDMPALVLDHVYLGSRSHAKDRDTLLKLGITHILNVTPARSVDPVAGVPNFFENDTRFTYRRCALYDNKGEDILTSIEGCLAFLDQAQFYGKVLVHCKQGVSRSASIVVAYVMRTKELSRDDALTFVQARRPEPNGSFLKQLLQYEVRLKQRAAIKATSTTTKERPVSPQAAIGPALPPHLRKSVLNETPSIGPQLPPKRRSSTSDATDSPTRKRTKPGEDASTSPLTRMT
ncbi:hypothetical protein, variant [Saprolegnia diclina VS20]|uniref:protein-tyrosine-phosphatase n=1 Tax=Saprolegnia diclina (strain VS20) TaxID=1156394 RepID=T0RWH3_SAPDV|nr:hypothetical protein, variant [Saprolegnia diclina VS20]EQC34692.1 hypothetical protein, variant [Saprolegnia diclina VS20]|eukprot:XP_008612098.1 hypothetical protein, variant [Saprolegnia diclina VS20]